MLRAFTFASLSVYVAIASATLLPRAGKIGSQCTNVRLTQGWLVGDCLTGSGTTRITSGTFLTNKITNDDANLKWKKNGSYATSCKDCQLKDGGSTLNCLCRPNFLDYRETNITLDEHIGVYSGHLLSDLDGAPAVPSAPSKYEFPGDLNYYIGGKATCPQESIPNWCRDNAGSCTSGGRSDFTSTFILNWAPISECWEPFYWFDDIKMHFDEIKIAGAGAWELVAYADKSCTKKLGTVSPEEAGTCKSFSDKVRGIITRPRFNGDPK